jgi:hypothetical protein
MAAKIRLHGREHRNRRGAFPAKPENSLRNASHLTVLRLVMKDLVLSFALWSLLVAIGIALTSPLLIVATVLFP